MTWNELPQIIKLLVALAFVLSLMGGLAFALKRLGLSGPRAPQKKKRRLRVVESLAIDARRRLLLIQRDEKQHLVILGSTHETLIETDIEPVKEENETND